MAVIKVFDRLPNVGDALFLVSGVKTWVRYSESAPSGGTFVGVVFHRDGHKVYTLEKTAVTRKYKTENTADGNAYTNSSYLRKDGSVAYWQGVMNTAIGVAYWGSNGRTPTANEPVPAANDTTPVTRAAFDSSEYCALLRQTYATYEAYIGEGMGVKFPQERGCFSLPSGKTITYTYNDSAHPAFQYCAAIDYSVAGLSAGDWYLPGVYEGTALMRDRVLTKVAATMTKFGGAVPNNSTYRWFAQRYNTENAWLFLGGYGHLIYGKCTLELAVQAVSLLIV